MVEVKQRNKDLLVSAVLVLNFALVVFSSYLSFKKYREFFLVDDVLPILMSVVFSLTFLSNLYRDYSNEGEEVKSYIKRALFSTIIGYIFFALSLFVSTKTVEVTSSNIREVEATVVNISRGDVLLGINGSYENIENVSNSEDLNIGAKITSISNEKKVIHFKSWIGFTKDTKKETTILKGKE